MEEELVPSRDRQALIRHRKCAWCGVTKPLNSECFGKKLSSKTSYRGVCRKCERKKS